MAVTVKKVTFWGRDVENKPGALAETLAPLAQAGADLQVVMGYPNPAGAGARVEVHPVSGKKSMDAAKSVEMAASPMPILVVQGDNRTGLGHAIAQSISEAGINVGFVMAQVIGRKYSAVLGFENDADASKAMGLIKKASAPARKR